MLICTYYKFLLFLLFFRFFLWNKGFYKVNSLVVHTFYFEHNVSHIKFWLFLIFRYSSQTTYKVASYCVIIIMVFKFDTKFLLNFFKACSSLYKVNIFAYAAYLNFFNILFVKNIAHNFLIVTMPSVPPYSSITIAI